MAKSVSNAQRTTGFGTRRRQLDIENQRLQWPALLQFVHGYRQFTRKRYPQGPSFGLDPEPSVAGDYCGCLINPQALQAFSAAIISLQLIASICADITGSR
jgi:hypothetical protein